MGVENANIFFKVAAALSVVAGLTHIVGFASPDWTVKPGGLLGKKAHENDKTAYGLWEACSGEQCLSATYFSRKLKASQALGTVGLILVLATAVGCALAVFVDSFRPRALLVAVCALLASVSIIICVIIMGSDIVSPGQAGYSLGLSVVGGILSLVTAGVLFFGHRQV